MDQAFERKLIEEAKKGSNEAFEKLILQYERNIYGICLRMLKDEQIAYDAAQEVCVKVWRQLDKFEGTSKLSTWIYRIATNQCLDMIRKNKKREEISFYQTNQETGEEWQSEGEEVHNPIEEHIENLALKDIVALALEEVKQEYKDILILRDMQGYSYDEIGKHMDLSIGTVKSRLSRARNAVKKILSQDREPYKSFFRHNQKKGGAR